MRLVTALSLLFPLLGFLILLFAAPIIKRPLASFLACLTVFLSFLCFSSLLVVFHQQNENDLSIFLFKWISLKEMQIDFILHLDTLSLLMALLITGIGFLIHVYSIGYTEHEEDFARYFACLNFFIFAMLLLVLAGDLFLLFIGWEGVGLASYLLIGFWHERPSAAEAATKAFVVNRIGDLGLLLGLLLTLHTFGTTHIAEISQQAGQQFALGAPLLMAMTLLYFWGSIGKSAQLPLYTWLPDAMEGPTPVSALIHAATMVTAGVYLVVRMHALFILAPQTLTFIGGIGVATALFAALCAMAQTDLKKVLAFSTISQLGLMFLACGIGAFYAAMFHLTMHAFVKALLFLSAGNVVHMLHGTTDMNKMGGLFKTFKATHLFFLIGVLALSGFPFFAAFFSKDLILELEYAAGFKTLFYIGLIASILTAFYLTRAYCLTFLGSSRLENQDTQEAPPVMLIPVALLAALSVIGGFIGFAFWGLPPLETFLVEDIGITPAEQELSTGFHFSPGFWMAVGGSLMGILAALLLHIRFRELLRKPILLFKKAFFVDDIYAFVFVRPTKALARSIAHFFEPKVFEGSLAGTVYLTQGLARSMQHIQSGQIRSYIAWMVIGTTLLLVYFIFEGLHG